MTVRDRFGLSAALATPFGPDGSVDLTRMTEHARWCLDQGCTSVTLFGTTGEGPSIGMSEREAILSAFARAGIGGAEVVVCAAASAPREALVQANAAIQFGGRTVLLTPPFYFKNPSEEGLFAWFGDVLDGLGGAACEVILYHIPSVTQVPLSLELVGRLKEAFPRIVAGVKDSAGDWVYTQALLAAHGDLAILIGDERYLAEGVRLGGRGAISGLANLCPRALLPLAVHGQGDERVNRLVDAVLEHPVVPAVKALVAHGRKDPAWRVARPPLVELAAAEAEQLAALYDRLFRQE